MDNPWSPQYDHVDRIKSEQNNFLLFALRRLNWNANLTLFLICYLLILVDYA